MRSELNIEKWKLFKVSDIFPKVSIKKHSKKPEFTGTHEFVSSSSMNNGVSAFVEEKTIPGNCITVSTNGDCFDAFYHENDIVVSSDVEVLYNPRLNMYNALFICSVLKLEKPKWTYGRKPKKNQVFLTQIKLPCLNGSPDWEYMENYIKENWLHTIGTNIIEQEIMLEVDDWKEFRLGDIIKKIYKAKANHKIYLEESRIGEDESVQYITRTEYNNGLESYVKLQENMVFENGDAITIGDTTATVFYQDIGFVCGDHIVVLRDDKMNKYVGLFLRTLINFERYRYSYGRAFTIDKIKNTIIKLPTLDGEPDWDFMESYIKKLQYSDRI